MKSPHPLTGSAVAVALVFLAGSVPPVSAADNPLGGMKLLPGYEHQPLQGIDSIVGRIAKEDGLTLTYEIGRVPQPGGLRLGGDFSDRPQRVPEAQRRWYREQTVHGQPVHLAYLKDGMLLVSFPQRGMNISVKVQNADEMADALLMILTYPAPPEPKQDPAE